MTLDAIQEEISEYTQFWGKSVDYIKKYFHKIPKSVSVDRVEFLLNRCKDKTVLHIGCSGPLHGLIRKVSKKAYGWDRVPVDGEDTFVIDIERQEIEIPQGVELILCAEILEHLSNPGAFLDKIHCSIPLIVTVPNAFGSIGFEWLAKGYENVNDEHVCYYSYKTMRTLLERHGYEITEWYWAGGKPLISETLIFVAR